MLSPHLDDAVLSCAHVLASAMRALAVTVFTATPPTYPAPLPAWDRSCGFAPGTDVMAVRRAEDEAALEALGAESRHLDFVDLPYRGGTEVVKRDLELAVAQVIAEFDPTTVLFPLAIQHPDHRATFDAALAARSRSDARSWVGYGEFPYVWREVDLAARRLLHLRRRGYRVTPVLEGPRHPRAKESALRAYRSQMAGLELWDDVPRVAEAPEQYWRITDRPPLAGRAVRWAGYRTGILK